MTDLIIFTDLDGCLLDDATYQWDAAAPALHALRRARIPLVLASSKTGAEMVPLAHDLGLADRRRLREALIVENGGGVLMPHDWAPQPVPSVVRTNDGWMVALGAPVPVLRDTLAEITRECGTATRGFSVMTDEEITALTGLNAEAVGLARQREFDEPFVLGDGRGLLDTETQPFEAAVTCLRQAAEERGCRITRGGRFLHLTSNTDKGQAASLVLRWYAGKRCLEKGDRPLFAPHRPAKRGLSPFSRQPFPHLLSVALGDSPNDLSLLRLVDQPIIVPRPNGQPHPELRDALPHATIAPHPGPAGWNHAVRDLLKRR
ncbi:MAG: hypothetical protein GEU99_15365 [Luteitalea sp.]|nr:hypothetical protein [Luteitalea sp.]